MWGDQTGLHPLVALLAIYVGLKIGDLLGMILGPVLVLMVRNLWQAGDVPRHRPGPDPGGPGYGGPPPTGRWWSTRRPESQRGRLRRALPAPLGGGGSKEGETVQKKGTES